MGAVAAAGIAYKNWPSSGELTGNFDPYQMPMDWTRVGVGTFAQNAIRNDMDYARKFSPPCNSDSTAVNTYSFGLSLALACGNYEFFDAFMNNFVESVSDKDGGLKNALLFYLFAFNCARSENWGRYACKNLIEHYHVLNLGDDSRIIDTSKFAGYNHPGWKPLSVAYVIAPVIRRDDYVLLSIIFNTRVEANFVRLVRDMGLANLDDDDGIHERLTEILRANKEDSRELPIFTQLYPQILNWRFDSRGNHVAAGTPRSHHLLMYAIRRCGVNCARALADKEILPNWWSITDDRSKSPFEYIKFLLGLPSYASDADAMKQLYCALWDKAVAQGAGAQLDQDLSPEKLKYR